MSSVNLGRDDRQIRDRLIAEILLDASSRAQYLLSRLVDINERWASISNGALMKLGRLYRAVVVVEALSYAYEGTIAPEHPYAWLETVCVRIENDRRFS